MAKERLSKALYVERGYGQVEPNHLSAQLTGQIYAQLPAHSSIDVLENGQFVKYDYANKVCNFTGKGEWMLVFNEIKLYRDELSDADFALKKGDYQARIYSPVEAGSWNYEKQTRYFNGKKAGTDEENNFPIEKVTAPADALELNYNEDPFHIESTHEAAKMPTGATMVPRVIKTNIGDILTTNCINAAEGITVGKELIVGDDGYLMLSNGEGAHTNAGTMKWEIVKVYTLADGQKAAKIMRIA